MAGFCSSWTGADGTERSVCVIILFMLRFMRNVATDDDAGIDAGTDNDAVDDAVDDDSASLLRAIQSLQLPSPPSRCFLYFLFWPLSYLEYLSLDTIPRQVERRSVQMSSPRKSWFACSMQAFVAAMTVAVALHFLFQSDAGLDLQRHYNPNRHTL